MDVISANTFIECNKEKITFEPLENIEIIKQVECDNINNDEDNKNLYPAMKILKGHWYPLTRLLRFWNKMKRLIKI